MMSQAGPLSPEDVASARRHVLEECLRQHERSPTAWVIWKEHDDADEPLRRVYAAARCLESEGLIRASFAADRTIVSAQLTQAGLEYMQHEEVGLPAVLDEGTEHIEMTRKELEERDALRLLVLRTACDAAKGSTLAVISVEALAGHLQVGQESLLEAVRFLAAEGLLQWHGTRQCCLTHSGVVEAEHTVRYPDRPTSHFPVTVIHQTFHAPVATGVQTGGTSSISLNVGSSPEDVARLLEAVRACLPESAVEAREALENVREELAAPHPKLSRLKAFGAALWSVTKGLLHVAPQVIELLEKLGLPHP